MRRRMTYEIPRILALHFLKEGKHVKNQEKYPFSPLAF